MTIGSHRGDISRIQVILMFFISWGFGLTVIHTELVFKLYRGRGRAKATLFGHAIGKGDINGATIGVLSTLGFTCLVRGEGYTKHSCKIGRSLFTFILKGVFYLTYCTINYRGFTIYV